MTAKDQPHFYICVTTNLHIRVPQKVHKDKSFKYRNEIRMTFKILLKIKKSERILQISRDPSKVSSQSSQIQRIRK